MMRVGINLINFGPSATPEALAGWAEMAERLGYHSLLTSDHIAVTRDVSERYPAPFYEPLTTLGWLAGITERVSLGTTVTILPYRNPLETARAFANLDQLSGGRIIFGIGIGWAEEEFAALNVAFRRRGAMTDEYLELVTRHWREPSLTFDGEFVSCAGVDTAPRPKQERVPLWVGGSSAAAFRRTAQYGTGWHPIRVRASWLVDRGVPQLTEAAERAGVERPDICPRILLHPTPQPVTDDNRFLGHGTFGQIAEDLAFLEGIGCAHVILDSYSPFDDSPFASALSMADPAVAVSEVQEQYEHLAVEILDLENETLR